VLYAPEDATSYKAFDSIFPLRLLPIEGGRTLDKFMESILPWHTQSEIPEGITVTGDNIGASSGVYTYGAKDIRPREEKRGLPLLGGLGRVRSGRELMGAEAQPG